MKKTLSIFLFSVMLLNLFTCTAMAAEIKAQPTASVVYVNGVKVNFEAYSINGNNYFKLRDLAMALKGTSKEFGVGYDSASGIVSIDTKGKYTPAGGELIQGNGQVKNAVSVKNSFQFKGKTNLDNYKIALNAYSIGGNNFVKLRDLMQWLNVGVGYDNNTGAITVTTHQNYELPKTNGDPLINAHAMENKVRSNYGNIPGNIMASADCVKYDNYYYLLNGYDYIYRYSADGKDIKSIAIDPRWIAGNLQAYNGKIYYEGMHAASITSRAIFSVNADGTGSKIIASGTIDQSVPHNITIYKGMIYACAYNMDGTKHIVSLNLDGTGRKDIYTGNMLVGAAIGKEIDGVNNFTVFNDRIYFFRRVVQENFYPVNLVSVNMTGGDLKIHCEIDANPALLQVDNNYVFYMYGNNIYRTAINGGDTICVYAGHSLRLDTVFYGDKIIYETGDGLFAIMNRDGTGRSIFPNSPLKGNIGVELNIVDSKYSYAHYMMENDGVREFGDLFLNNNSYNPGYVSLTKAVKDKGTFSEWRVSNKAFPDKDWSPQSYKYVNPEDGTYVLKAYYEAGKAMAIGANSINDGEKVILWDVSGKDNQKFEIKTEKNQSTIKAVHSGKNLFAPNEKGAALQQHGSSSAKFFFVDAGNHAVNIITEDGYYLSASAGKYDNGTPIICWTRSKEGSQKFHLSKTKIVEKAEPKVDFADVKSGVYFITKDNSRKVFDISGASKKDDEKVLLWDLTSGENQKFIITMNGNKCTIQAKHSGKNIIAPNKKGGALKQSGSLPATIFYLVDAGDGVVNLLTEDGYYIGVSDGKVITCTKANDGSQDFVLREPYGE